jgi:SNF2 family DNA or RNA helicase
LRDSLIELALNGEKALIFVPYTQAIYDLRKWYRLLIPNSYSNVINGATPIDERQNIVDEFSKFTGSGLLLLNPKAGGVGLNITAANHVFHFSPDWNPAVVDQASARSYRRGQKLPVTIHNLFYADSIEEYMVQRLGQKRVLSEDALEGTSTTPTLEELNEALKRMPVI